MKLVSFFSRLAALAFATFVVGLVLNTQALALFAFAVSAFIVLIVVGDYAPRTSRGRRHVGAVVAFSATPAAVATSPAKLAA
jgi:hypothetical protein